MTSSGRRQADRGGMSVGGLKRGILKELDRHFNERGFFQRRNSGDTPIGSPGAHARRMVS
jgi:hypothetical protein